MVMLHHVLVAVVDVRLTLGTLPELFAPGRQPLNADDSLPRASASATTCFFHCGGLEILPFTFTRRALYGVPSLDQSCSDIVNGVTRLRGEH